MAEPVYFLNHHVSGRKSYFSGLLLPLSTIVTLLAVSAMLAFAPLLWTAAVLQAATYMSWLAYSMVGVVALSLTNFWFAREIQFHTLGCSNYVPNTVYGKKHRIKLEKLINHLCQELNAHDGTLDPKHPNHLSFPRIAVFKEHHPKIVAVPGRSMDTSALYISAGMLELSHTHLSQKALASMIMAELYQIKRRRTFSDMVLNIVDEFAKTLDHLMSSNNLFYKTLGYLLVPLKICFVFHNALSRTYVYEAARAVSECGRGDDYLDALEKLKNPEIVRKGNRKNIKLNAGLQEVIHLSRPPYQDALYNWMRQIPVVKYFSFLGRFVDFVLKPIADWVDSKELTTSDHRTSRFFSFFDTIYRDGAFFLKEMVSTKPSNTNVKDYLKEVLQDDSIIKQPFRIPQQHRYKVIDPILSQSYVPPYKRKKFELKQMKARLNKLQNLFENKGNNFTREEIQQVFAPLNKEKIIQPVQLRDPIGTLPPRPVLQS